MTTNIPRLHGNTKLKDPSLEKRLCPTCNKKTDWEVTEKEDGGYVKKCKGCGKVIHVKAPKPKKK